MLRRSAPQPDTVADRMALAAEAASRGDYETAHGTWVKLGHAAVARAQAEIGRCFVQGLGVEHYVPLALKWLMPAAQTGDALARSWRNAALLGDADGQAMLGAAHLIGSGVARDAVAALAWLTRAKAGGSPFADRFYDGVRASCSAEQIARAERRAVRPLQDEEAAP